MQETQACQRLLSVQHKRHNSCFLGIARNKGCHHSVREPLTGRARTGWMLAGTSRMWAGRHPGGALSREAELPHCHPLGNQSRQADPLSLPCLLGIPRAARVAFVEGQWCPALLLVTHCVLPGDAQAAARTSPGPAIHHSVSSNICSWKGEREEAG